jgi:hypothetical protein
MKLFYVLLSLLLFACSADETENKIKSETGRLENYFPNFPEVQFQNIQLGDSMNYIRGILETEEYCAKIARPNHFKSLDSEVEIILPESDVLNNFKVFFYHEDDIEQKEQFLSFFSENSEEESTSNEFSYFTFKTQKAHFSITLFEQEDFLRLNFELKTTR